jgi:hypothetical protein
MAKKVTAAKPQPEQGSKQLIDAIVTVKNLQEFIKEHGGLAQALGAVARVRQMIDLTGSFDELKQALEIVGRDETAPPAE